MSTRRPRILAAAAAPRLSYCHVDDEFTLSLASLHSAESVWGTTVEVAAESSVRAPIPGAPGSVNFRLRSCVVGASDEDRHSLVHFTVTQEPAQVERHRADDKDRSALLTCAVRPNLVQVGHLFGRLERPGRDALRPDAARPPPCRSVWPTPSPARPGASGSGRPAMAVLPRVSRARVGDRRLRGDLGHIGGRPGCPRSAAALASSGAFLSR